MAEIGVIVDGVREQVVRWGDYGRNVKHYNGVLTT